MAQSARRRNVLIALIMIIIAILLLLTRCLPSKPAVPAGGATTTQSTPPPPAQAEQQATAKPAIPEPDEVLTPATLTGPAQVAAGAAFSITWTGPDNRGDYLTIARPDAPAAATGNYRETQHGPSLELTAPMDPGDYEVRYITARSRTILGRAALEVQPVVATLDAPAEISLGAPFSITWTGPNNKGDYITIVSKDARDDQYGNYTNTDNGSPLTLTAPTLAGDAELRYISGEARKVLTRRSIKVAAPEITLAAPAAAIAGTTIEVVWAGPNNAGDFITVVPAEMADGGYGNYTDTSKGSPLKLLAPIMAGAAELRYMTAQGRRVLGRRPITIIAAAVTLSAPPECAPGAAVTVAWTGPNNPGDYITIVATGTPDDRYGAYTNTSKGSPLTVNAPKETGDAEIRYVAGQGNKVLARIPIKVVP